MQINVLHMAALTNGYGVERQLIDHLSLAMKNPNEIRHYVCAIELSDSLMRELKAQKIPVVLNPLRSLKQFKDFSAFVKKHNIHILHVHDRLKIPLRARILPKLAGVPLIVEHEHGYVWREFSTRFLNSIRLIKWTNGMVNLNICNSNAAKIILKEKCDIEAKVIYNGVKLPPVDENNNNNSLQRQLGFPENTRIVGFVGRLNTPKGVPAFIRSIPLIKQAVPQARFIIAGDGPMRSELETAVENLEVRKDVYFLGYQKDVREFMKEMDVLVVPSICESFGNVVIEAALAKKPVVASSVDGIAETVLDGETGFLVDCTEPIQTSSPGAITLPKVVVDGGGNRELRPPRLPNVEMLAEKIIKCLLDPELAAALGNNAYLRATSLFSLERYRNELDDIYRGLVKSLNVGE